MPGPISAGVSGLLAHLQSRLTSECNLIGALPAPAHRAIESLVAGCAAELIHDRALGLAGGDRRLEAMLGRVRYEIHAVVAAAHLPTDYGARMSVIVCECLRAGLAALVPALAAGYTDTGDKP